MFWRFGPTRSPTAKPARITILVVTATLAALTAVNEASATDVDFNRDIRSILANRCFKCHGPDEAARQGNLRLDLRADATAPRRSGVAIVPGHPERSRLITRITAPDEDERMPPAEVSGPLPAAEVELLRRWIEEGAEYKEHWAFVPPLRPPLPTVKRDEWPRGGIDRFILARIEREGLAPSAEADRATLIRRVSLDLTGLPPAPEEVSAFLADERPDAYGAVVDRLLESEHYGERWARLWLDLARYADTKGYEADRRRTIWPYRDWVIDALNRDLPFDEFTIEQIAGDLLPEPTDDQLLATAFHRNTMTNDEGGTDDEEFRVAAVVDRVNTTASVWMGLTMGCAQCHTHKFDPIRHEEYYRFLAFFDDTADSDAMDERPLLALLSVEQRERRAELEAERAGLRERIDGALAAIDGEDAPPPAPPASPEAPAPRTPVDFIWIDDDLPPGARSIAGAVAGPWQWESAERHGVFSGTRASRRTARGIDQHFFTDAFHPLEIHDGDVLFAHVFIDPADRPRSIMIQWHDAADWEHRAYWGEPVIPWGSDGSPSRLPMGPVPEAGQWVRLAVEAKRVGLPAGAVVTGVALSQYDGTVHWDAVGVRTAHPPDERYLASQAAWEELALARDRTRLPAAIVEIVAIAPATRTDEQQERVRRFYYQNIHRASRDRLAPLAARLEAIDGEQQAILGAAPRVPIMRELEPERQRTTHVHQRGNFLDPGSEVTPGVPEALSPLPDDAPRNRLGLARWLVAADNPLTARVIVNRYWEQFFGTGIVRTVEDFGTQGTYPSHPALLDWLATELVARNWSLKDLCRVIATSATYRQSSSRSPELIERDPRNTLLAAGPRFRLEAEMIRDQALAVSGLLNPTLHGPPVFPPQPDGIWQIIYSDERWEESSPADQHRRALYTFWRRTSPYPSMLTFDAPSREFCVPRRLRTNTPLQALVTLNDPVYVEAARALARRIVTEGGSDAHERASYGFRLCLARTPRPEELRTLVGVYEAEFEHYRRHPEDAEKMAGAPPVMPGQDSPGEGAHANGDDADELTAGAADADLIDAAERAAWTVVGNVLMNLDEFLNKG